MAQTITVTTVGVSTEHVAVANAIYLSGKNPIQVVCPTCHQHVITQVEEETGACTWISVGILFLFCPCFSCIPLCLRDCKDLYHYCPNCRSMLGVKKPM